MDKYIGKKLDGRYIINELIGIGGMAMVYKAQDIIDDRIVAIKILKDEYLNNQEFIRRFKNESKAIAVMSHPNIVKVYDVSFGNIIQYIVMEYVDGITLKEYIDNRKEISWKEAVHFATQILQALQHAHEKGIVHRDIKPQNVILLSNGNIKVADFGIATFSNKDQRTMTEKAIGTVHYISPEQVSGDIVNYQSDIYSLGIVMYELLTGKLPFEAESLVSVAIMQLQDTPKKPTEINSDIPEGLEEITLKAMNKDKNQRYHSVEEMLEDLETFKKNPSIKFQYSYYSDDLPTKYIDTINNVKSENQEYSEVVDFNDEEVIVKKKNPTFHIITGSIVAALIVIALFSVLTVFKSCSYEEQMDVDVPQLVGLNFEQQVRYSDKYNFKWNVENDYDEDQPLGVILEQKPEFGSKKIKTGSEITIVVNSDQTMILIPNINGLQQEDATTRLKKRNIKYEVLEVIDDNTAKGYVITSDPLPGSEITMGTTIKLYVSAGISFNQFEVPYLVGCTMSEAQTKLNEAGLVFGGYEYGESNAKKNTVISQNPLQGARVSEGTAVTVILSEGPPADVELKAEVTMPTLIEYPVSYKVTVDGTKVLTDTIIVPSRFNDNFILLKAKSNSEPQIVTVELNGHIYREFKFDFVNKKIETLRTEAFVPLIVNSDTDISDISSEENSSLPPYNEESSLPPDINDPINEYEND